MDDDDVEEDMDEEPKPLRPEEVVDFFFLVDLAICKCEVDVMAW